jgi:protein-S-isoprenylcysteine O-methyltransferase Ste14
MLFTHANLFSVTVALGGWLSLLVFSFMRSHRQGRPKTPAKRDLSSLGGVLVQGLGIAAAWAAPVDFDRDLFSQAAVVEAAIVTVLALASLVLFSSAQKTLGANWTVVATVREGASLVTKGPFAFVRNPIYLAIMGLMIATGLALGHPFNLIAAIPIYIVGTALRVLPEERLLRERFGAEFEAYAARIKRLIPFVW